MAAVKKLCAMGFVLCIMLIQTITSSAQENKVIPLPDSIGVIELRNYILKKGARDQFINYFETHFIEPQKALKGYPLGQFTIKDEPDHFFWIRAFADMKERSSFLPAFYYGPVWKQHRVVANNMLANNDNVHLLRPMRLVDDSIVAVKSLPTALLLPKAEILVIDFYISNTRLPELLRVFAKDYLPLISQMHLTTYSLWTAEPEENDFPKLPVFQDKNLLVMISHYKNESAYKLALKKINAKMTDSLKAALQDVITLKQTLILYPTQKTITQ